MNVFAVLKVHDQHFEAEGADGDIRSVSREGIDWPLQEDMPVLIGKDGKAYPYLGAFLDEEDGVYKKVAFEGGRFVLVERPAPLTKDALTGFLETLVREGGETLREPLDQAIEDLLAAGKTELAFALMGRQEALSPSKSMAAARERNGAARRGEEPRKTPKKERAAGGEK